MPADLTVSSWVGIRAGCPLSYRINGDEIEFRCGSARHGFEFVFDVPALRDFAAVTARALAEVAEPAP